MKTYLHMSQVIKIYLNVPLRKVPFRGLFRFNGKLYERGSYNHQSKIYHCYLEDEHDPYLIKIVNFHPSEIVSFYKRS